MAVVLLEIVLCSGSKYETDTSTDWYGRVVKRTFDDEQWLANFSMSLWVSKCLEMEPVYY